MLLKSKAKITGKVTVKVFGPDGNLKRFEPTWLERLLGLPGRPMMMVNHNIVTDEGDGLIADLLDNTPTQTKVDGTNGYIAVGTGFVSEAKSATGVTTITGSPEILDSGYPQTQGAFGAANDNLVDYRATFEAGDLNATGIDEAALLNNSVPASADCLAYAQITPAVNVTTSDTLEVTWTLTITGS